AGKYKVVVGDDGWTIRTKDGSPSAHFEHTIVVRNGNAEILT
ncbi:MAG: type I methionyl aminopeptidase, partial [Bacteroidetes bacterium]|nr:type I methionyl aminopeptidase [Bacteroidota bacterium]